jgi:tRNA pseudouridine55 synthase
LKSGVLNVYKEKGFTSHDVVAKIRKLYGTKKVGHTGTLDPQATGCLPVLVGSAVKACDLIPEEGKTYRATVRFGIETDTEDIWGKVIKEDKKRLDEETFRSRMLTFLGEYHQIPPMVSAIKVGGKKLYEYAREGKVIEREARPITVHELDIDGEGADYTMRVFCSKGTYIRTLCADIGNKLGCGGVMSSLIRTETGGFPLADAHTMEALEEMSREERISSLIPTEALFASLPKVCLSAFFEKLCRGGCEIYLSKIGAKLEVGTRVRICDENGMFFALGEVGEYENGRAVKAIKTFTL